MKKLALTTICALAITGTAFAQGSVNWSTPFGFVTAQTNSTQYSPLMGGGAAVGGAVGVTGSATTSGLSYYYELLYSTYSGSQATIGSLSSLLSWNDTLLGATNGSVAGRLTPIAINTQATVPWAAGTTDSIVLVGWSANLGTSWGVVSNLLATGDYLTTLGGQNGFLGITPTGYIAPNSANPGVSVFAGPGQSYGLPISSLNTQLYLLPVVPEPTTLALAGLGGLSLLLFRRRQQK